MTDITMKQLHEATWIPHPCPKGTTTEVSAPWTTNRPQRLVVAVESDGDVFVIASLEGVVKECWKVLFS